MRLPMSGIIVSSEYHSSRFIVDILDEYIHKSECDLPYRIKQTATIVTKQKCKASMVKNRGK